MPDTPTDKNKTGNFFEDFSLGQTLRHATPRTLTEGDASLYTALYGSRFPLFSSDEVAKNLGYRRAPLDELLVFHTVFGKTVPDLSLNAVANLGYADCRFLRPVFVGDTLRAESEIIGLKKSRRSNTGVVYARSKGFNQRGETVLEFIRWVLVRADAEDAATPEEHVPEVPGEVAPDHLTAPEGIDFSRLDIADSGSPHLWADYRIGERIDHIDGVTIEEAEHMMAARLYQNSARVHFNQFAESQRRFGRRIVYGGHVISMARALSFNGLANAVHVAAINGGTHVAPTFAGDTVSAWSQILDKAEIAGRRDVAAVRVRTIASTDHPCRDFPGKTSDKTYHPAVVLDLDYWVLMPRGK